LNFSNLTFSSSAIVEVLAKKFHQKKSEKTAKNGLRNTLARVTHARRKLSARLAREIHARRRQRARAARASAWISRAGLLRARVLHARLLPQRISAKKKFFFLPGDLQQFPTIFPATADGGGGVG